MTRGVIESLSLPDMVNFDEQRWDQRFGDKSIIKKSDLDESVYHSRYILFPAFQKFMYKLWKSRKKVKHRDQVKTSNYSKRQIFSWKPRDNSLRKLYDKLKSHKLKSQ